MFLYDFYVGTALGMGNVNLLAQHSTKYIDIHNLELCIHKYKYLNTEYLPDE